MTLEAKDLKLLKTDLAHRVREVNGKVARLEKRIDWLEKLLWLSAGAVISWLAGVVLRNV
jgi:hypothetical protein